MLKPAEDEYDANTYASDLKTLKNGKSLFTLNCNSCHALEQDGIGPPLGGVTSILNKNELIYFVQHTAEVLASGDKRANYLLDKYNSPMPSFPFLSKDEIGSIFAYIDQESKQYDLKNAQIDIHQKIDKTLRYAAPILNEGLVVELDDPINIPLDPKRTSRKGIATLRTTPSLPTTLFVSDQMGKIYQVKNDSVSLVLDVASKFSKFIFEPGHGTGLGSFALHPDFESNGLLYTTHAEKSLKKNIINKTPIPDQDGLEIQWILTEWTIHHLSDPKIEPSNRELLRITMPAHAHGMQDIAFNPYLNKEQEDYGLLYIGVGDGGSINREMPELANQIKTPLGAILRIDPLGKNSENGQYGIPKNNPFSNLPNNDIQKEIFANGFRNPHRMCWGKDGIMLASDVGESHVEEINKIESGKNYGWNLLEGSYGLDTQKDAKKLFKASPELLSKYALPYAAYDHKEGNAVSGGFIYDGSIEILKGKYVFGDIVNGRLFYFDVDSSSRPDHIHEMKIFKNNKEQPLKDLIGSRNTNLRLGYDENNKALYIMTKKDGGLRKLLKAYYLENTETLPTAVKAN